MNKNVYYEPVVEGTVAAFSTRSGKPLVRGANDIQRDIEVQNRQAELELPQVPIMLPEGKLPDNFDVSSMTEDKLHDDHLNPLFSQIRLGYEYDLDFQKEKRKYTKAKYGVYLYKGCIVVPNYEPVMNFILSSLHDDPMAGHNLHLGHLGRRAETHSKGLGNGHPVTKLSPKIHYGMV